MVRSKKRKATEPGYRGHDRSSESDRHGGAVRIYGQEQR